MKKNIHPKMREVVFRDISCGFEIITLSSAAAKEECRIKGKKYPLLTFDVSSQSHPFYTGRQRLVDTEGLKFENVALRWPKSWVLLEAHFTRETGFTFSVISKIPESEEDIFVIQF